jgi:hypothetical protein
LFVLDWLPLMEKRRNNHNVQNSRYRSWLENAKQGERWADSQSVFFSSLCREGSVLSCIHPKSFAGGRVKRNEIRDGV